jgi:hypothetical protein
VVNTAPDRLLNWTFTEVFSLGDGNLDSHSFFRRSAGADGEGRVYVLDRGNHRVVVFDSAGIYLRTLGREGNGPGEFDLPIAFTVEPDGRVSVYDVSKHGLVNFAPDGSLMAGEPLRLPYMGGRIARSSMTLAIALQESGTSTGTVMERVVAVQGGDTLEVVRLIKPGPTPVFLRSCGVQLQDLSPFFQPSLRWDLRDGTVVASAGHEYRVDVISRGSVVASYRRNVYAREATLELATAEVGESMRFGNRVCDATDIAEQVGHDPFIPVIADLRVGPDGTIWVKRYAPPGEASQTDILSEAGEYVGTLPPGAPYPAAFLPAGKVVCEDVDENDAEKVTVYAVGRSQ